MAPFFVDGSVVPTGTIEFFTSYNFAVILAGTLWFFAYIHHMRAKQVMRPSREHK